MSKPRFKFGDDVIINDSGSGFYRREVRIAGVYLNDGRTADNGLIYVYKIAIDARIYYFYEHNLVPVPRPVREDDL